MATATFTKFNSFTEALAEKVHNLGADTLKVMLTSVAPVAANSVKADLVEIAAGNGYTAGGNTAGLTTSSQTAGVYKLVLADPALWTCVTANMASFRYMTLYNDTATNKELIGFWDFGQAVVLTPGDTFLHDFDPSTGVLTIT